MGPLERLVLATLPFVPTPVMRRMASRYIAGETLEEALAVLERYGAQGYPGILDLLGEAVQSVGHARAACDTYCEAAGRIRERGLDAYVSVKPTHFGLSIAEDLALELYRKLCARCAELDLFVRVEMEDHPTTDATLRVFEALRAQYANVGVVLQSRLFRTPDDVAALAAGPLNVRMVKGIYLEPAEIAHTEPEPIREAFVRCTEQLWDRGAYVSLATHDDRLADALFAEADRRGIGPDGYELQVLLGVREDLWKRWRAAGRPVRVYVPYGPEWRAYSTRRLQKNPQILRAVLRNSLPF